MNRTAIGGLIQHVFDNALKGFPPTCQENGADEVSRLHCSSDRWGSQRWNWHLSKIYVRFTGGYTPLIYFQRFKQILFRVCASGRTIKLLHLFKIPVPCFNIFSCSYSPSCSDSYYSPNRRSQRHILSHICLCNIKGMEVGLFHCDWVPGIVKK